MEFYKRPNSYDISFELLLETVGCEDGYLYYSRNGKLVVEKLICVKDQMLVCKSGFCADPRLLDANIQRRLREHFVDSHKKVEKLNFIESNGVRILRNGQVLYLKFIDSDFDSNTVKLDYNGVSLDINLHKINLQQQKDLFLREKKENLLDICVDAFALIDKIMKNPFDKQKVDALRFDFAKFILDDDLLDLLKKDQRYAMLYEFFVDFEGVLQADFLDLKALIRVVIKILSKRSYFRGMPIYDSMNDFLDRVYPQIDLILLKSKMSRVARGFKYTNLSSLCRIFTQNYKKLDSNSRQEFVDAFSNNLHSFIDGFDIKNVVDENGIDDSLKAIAFVFKILESKIGSLIYFSEQKKDSLKRLYQNLQMRKIAIVNYTLWDLPAENLIGKTNEEIIFLTSEIAKAMPGRSAPAA